MEVHSTEVTEFKHHRDGDQLLIEATWDLVGSVQHWGHIHTRRDTFTGTIKLNADRGHWAMESFLTIDQKRHPIETQVRY